MNHLPAHDYAALDAKKYPATYAKDQLAHVKTLGFNYISQATVELYRKHKSQAKVALILNLTEPAIRARLKKYNEPRRGPGGTAGIKKKQRKLRGNF